MFSSRPKSKSSAAAEPTIPYRPHTLSSPTARVHLEYDPALSLVPRSPGPGWTRFVCVSDTHAREFGVPGGDVLLHAGDLTNTGRVDEFERTVSWLCGLPHRVKIIIAGNHDLPLHEEWYDRNYTRWHRNGDKQSIDRIMTLLKGPKAKRAGLVYLQDEAYAFQAKDGGRTWSIYGSPWSPEFYDWAFNYTEDEAEKIASRIPKTDILLTHGPARGIFDRTLNTGELAGCPALRARLKELAPRLHVAGHIHEAHGAVIHAWGGRSGAGAESGSRSGSGSEPPFVQAEGEGEEEEEEEEDDLDDLDLKFDEERRVGVESLQSEEEEEDPRPRTVFVNAANWPLGRRAWRSVSVPGKKTERVRVPFGGPGFQPVIVDLKDDV